jgi:hypothetical protein
VPVSLTREKPYRRFVAAFSTAPSSRAAPASFAAVFEALVAKVSSAAKPDEIRTLHAAFEQRTGTFGPDDPWFELRSRAFWDDAMTRRDAASRVLLELDGPERAWAEALPRAHRGLFEARHVDGGLVLHDVLGGAELFVHEMDEASRDALAGTSSLFDGTVAARKAPVRLALLPGAIFHRAEAAEAIAQVVAVGRARGLTGDTLLDALLRMELSLRVLSRVKPSYAYRAEALPGA